MAFSKRVQGTGVTLAVLAAAAPIGIWLIDTLTPSLVRQALPAAATDVQEYCDVDWNGDYARWLQAKIPQSEMPRFAEKLGLQQRYQSGKHAPVMVSFEETGAPSWWHAPASLEGAYFKYKPGEERYSVALYQNGQVYYLATAW